MKKHCQPTAKNTLSGLYAGLILIFSGLPCISSAQEIDFTRAISGEGLFFAPYEGLNRGPIWFLDYLQSRTEPSAISDKANNIFVTLTSDLHANHLDIYNEFIFDNNIVDARVNHYPDIDPLCEVDSGLLEKLKLLYLPSPDLPTDNYFMLSISYGGYPSLCRLRIVYFNDDYVAYPDAENELLTYIDNHVVLNSHANITLPYTAIRPDLLTEEQKNHAEIKLKSTVKIPPSF